MDEKFSSVTSALRTGRVWLGRWASKRIIYGAAIGLLVVGSFARLILLLEHTGAVSYTHLTLPTICSV